jgi:hypothetical protein
MDPGRFNKKRTARYERRQAYDDVRKGLEECRRRKFVEGPDVEADLNDV